MRGNVRDEVRDEMNEQRCSATGEWVQPFPSPRAHLAHGGILRDVLQVVEEVRHLPLQQLARPLATLQRLIPKRADVHTHALGRLYDFAERPHERTVDADELLCLNGVGLVENDADLVVVALERLDGVLELVGDVKLVRVEELRRAAGGGKEQGSVEHTPQIAESSEQRAANVGDT